MAILAARGIEELVLRWQSPGRRIQITVFAFTAVMLPILAASTLNPLSVTLPYHRMAKAIEPLFDSNATDSMVFLITSPRFKSHFFNLNAADWRHAPIVVLGDPGSAMREKVVRDFGRTHWWVASYDEDRGQPDIVEGGKVSDPAPTRASEPLP